MGPPGQPLHRRLSRYFWGFPPFLALVETIALAVHFQDMDMVGEAVQQSPGQAFRAEYLRPLIERVDLPQPFSPNTRLQGPKVAPGVGRAVSNRRWPWRRASRLVKLVARSAYANRGSNNSYTTSWDTTKPSRSRVTIAGARNMAAFVLTRPSV